MGFPSLRRLALFLCLFIACAQATEARPKPVVPIMSVSEIRAGMKGYGLTVFSGTHIESFPVTVLGVVKSYIGDSDLILIHVDGGYPARHGIGIVAGMSGSPVYVQGRLIGAVAYGWAFSKEPIGGVTPIESMLEDLPGSAAPAAARSRSATARLLDVPIRTAQGLLTRVQVVGNVEAGRAAATPGTLTLTPVPSLLQISGFSTRAFDRIAPGLRRLGLEPVRTPAAAAPARVRLPRMSPGAAVGVELLNGDLVMASTGTLTYIDGRQFLAFGHPMAQLGEVRLPLTASYVQGVLPSYQHPFKFASQIGAIGQLTSDRLWAVGGTFGPSAPMIPVTVHVRESSHGRQRTYRLRAIQHRLLTPYIIAQATVAGVNSSVPAGSESTAQVHFRIRPHGRAPIDIEQTLTGANMDDVIALQLQDALSQLMSNEFAPLTVDNVEVDARLRPGRRTATVERLYTTRSGYRRGDTIDVHVVLRPYGGAPFERVVSVPIPADLEKGPVVIGVGGGNESATLRKRLGVGRPEPTSIDQLVRQIESQERGHQLVVRAVYPTRSATVLGERYSFLPEGLREALPTLLRSDVGAEKDVFETRIDLPWVVRGAETLTADLGASAEPERKKGAEGTARHAPPLASGGADGRFVGSTPPPQAATAAALPATRPATSRTAPVIIDSTATNEKVLPGGTRRWDLRDANVLGQGGFDGTSLSEEGTICIAPPGERLATTGTLPWCLAADPKRPAWLAGTASQGRVLLLPTDGRAAPITAWTADDAAVSALGFASDGSVWAGTSPRGRILRVAPGRTPVRVAETGSGYVWGLVAQPDGSVIAATGSPARLLRVDRDGRIETLASFPERHARAVTPSRRGGFIVATASPGVVYHVHQGRRDPLFTSAYGSVDALIERADGEIAAVSGRNLYRWAAGRRMRVVPVSDKALLALTDLGERLVVAGVSGRLHTVDANDRVARVADPAGGAVTALVTEGDGVLAACAGTGAFFRLRGAAAQEGAWTSEVLDAGGTARWGRLRWMREGDGLVLLQSRSGDTPVPDDTWSPWSPEYTAPEESLVSSPRGRYLQVRARLVRTGEATSPALTSLSIFFRNDEAQPVVELSRPKGGERLAGAQRIVWRTSSAPLDGTTFTVSYRRESGTRAPEASAWTPIRRGLGPTLREGAADGSPAPDSAATEELPWDTRTVPDGCYRLRVQARNSASSDDAVEESTVSKPFIITNTPPALEALRTSRTADGRWVVRGVARGRLAAIVSVAWRPSSGRAGDWRIALPEDGLYDSEREAFVFSLDERTSVEIRATDEAGNSRTQRRELSP